MTPYATFGSPELARATAAGLAGRSAVLMRNHGVTTIADDLPRALSRAFTVEWIASVYWHAKMLGTPTLIDAAELDRVRERQRVQRGGMTRAGSDGAETFPCATLIRREIDRTRLHRRRATPDERLQDGDKATGARAIHRALAILECFATASASSASTSWRSRSR